MNNNTLFHPNESRITTGSPRRSVGAPTAAVLSSQRGSAQGGERSVFLGTINSLASRFHSTQRSAKNQSTIQDDNEEEMIKAVEKELPLKFKNFGNTTFKTGESQFTTIFSPQKSSSMRSLKEDLARLSVQQAKEQFTQNKFSRPSQLIAPIDTVDYKRDTNQAKVQERMMFNKQFNELRGKAVLYKNNETSQIPEP